MGAVCAESPWPYETAKTNTLTTSSVKTVRLRMPFSGIGTTSPRLARRVHVGWEVGST